MVQNSIKNIIPVLFQLAVTIVKAQQMPSIVQLNNVEEAIEYAINNNADLKIQHLNREKSNANYKASLSHWYPVVSGSFTGQENLSLGTTVLPGEIFGKPGETIEARFGKKYNYNAGLNASMSLWDWSAIMKSRIADNEIKIAGAQEEAYKQTLTEQVILHYYLCLIFKWAIQIGVTDYETVADILKITQEKFNQGLVNKIEINSAEINLNNIEQNLIKNTHLLEDYKFKLQILLGLPFTTIIEFNEDIKFSNPGIDYSGELSFDKNLQLYELQVRKSNLDVKFHKSLFYPELSLGSYIGKQQFRDDFGLSFSSGSWKNLSNISLKLSIPVFTGFANKHQLKASKINERIAEETFYNEEQKSIINDELLLQEYESSLQISEVAYKNFLLADDNVKLSFQKYEQGIIGLEMYLKLFDDYLTAENNYLNTLSNLYGYYATLQSRNK
ncbi:TolC family protein [Abyssalbus ytuae]|uniref:TolC family protein n=1 Tax=Abyssalbus ytuae TaxID=2926907 RepID=A0A9E7D2G0_9FLAO|nr:TolC family protein [Abyssalbus ytuae]UOB18128.1 TolC family protein [Abyssalbus ytuae]